MSKSRSGAPRRVAAGLLAGSLAVLGLAFAPPAGATDTATFDRIAGVTRYGTAGAGTAVFEGVGTYAYPAGNTCALIATGEVFADSLAGSGLAGAMGCPILLVQQDAIPAETQVAIDQLGVTDATILGGQAAVSQGVEDALTDQGIAVDRIFGPTRYETAAEIADAIDAINPSALAIVASGEVAADAQSSGPIAAAQSAPILLTTRDNLPSASSNALAGRTEVLVAGGTARVSDATQADIEAASADDAAERLAGLDRQETAAIIGGYEVDTLGWAPDTVLLAAPNAPNDDFSPDALVAGPLGGLLEAPTLIVDDVDNLGPDADGFIDDHSDTIGLVLCVGGTAVLSEALCEAGQAAAQNTANDTATAATDAPELIAIEFANLTSTGGSAGVGQLLVRAVFDEPVLATPIVQTGFKLYTAYGESQTSVQAQLNATDPSKVDVVFDIFAGASFAAIEGTLMTVVANTVQDSDGKVNPEGEQPGFITQTFAPGITRNSDLTSVALVTADTVYDFTFDSAVQVLTTTGFRMVDTGGAERTSTSAVVLTTSTPANTVIRVTFAAPAAGTTGVRGGVIGGSVARPAPLGAFTTPTETADVTGGALLTDSPDLVSVTFDDVNDRVTYTFDEVIDTLDVAGSRTGFHVYYRLAGGAAQTSNSSLATDKSASDPRSIIAQFPADTINEFLAGAFIDTGAVARLGSPLVTAKTDEEGVGSSFAPGAYLGPELVSATSANSTNVFNTVTGRKVTFVWDERVTLTNAAGFFVTDSDGNRTNLTGCVLGTVGGSPDDTTVICTVTGTTGTVFTEIGDSELASVISGAVTGVARRATANGALSNLIANHEEVTSAPGTARDVPAP